MKKIALILAIKFQKFFSQKSLVQTRFMTLHQTGNSPNLLASDLESLSIVASWLLIKSGYFSGDGTGFCPYGSSHRSFTATITASFFKNMYSVKYLFLKKLDVSYIE